MTTKYCKDYPCGRLLCGWYGCMRPVKMSSMTVGTYSKIFVGTWIVTALMHLLLVGYLT